MRVLITGGAGFSGSHIADTLRDSGHEPVLLDTLLPQAHGGQEPPWPAGHELTTGDVTDRAVLENLLPGVDAVCHQAAMVGQGVDPSDLPDFAYNNDYATAVLLGAMHEHGVRRLVLASSMVVYGEGRYRCQNDGTVAPLPRTAEDVAAGRFEPRCPHCGGALVSELVGEDAPLDPRSAYAATKLAQEHLAASWARQTGGSVWALRYHNVYGPRMPRDTPYAGVASIFRSALESGQAPMVMEDGEQRRDFVHVTDVARANALALQADAGAGRLLPLNVCSGTPHTINDLATALCAAMGGPDPVVVGGSRSGDVRHVVADPTRARELLGFTGTVGFTEGMAEFATAPLRSPAGAA